MRTSVIGLAAIAASGLFCGQAFAAPRVVAILVGNTDDIAAKELRLGPSVAANINEIRTFLGAYVHDVGQIPVDTFEITGKDFNCATIRNVLAGKPVTLAGAAKRLDIQVDDTVIFYYSGHGYHDAKVQAPNDKFPMLVCSSRANNPDPRADLSLSGVVGQITAMKPRFTIGIADACNNPASPSALSDSVIWTTRGKPFTTRQIMRRLFLGYKGTLIFSASSPESNCSHQPGAVHEWFAYYFSESSENQKGGLFTLAFMTSINAELSRAYAEVPASPLAMPRWENIEAVATEPITPESVSELMNIPHTQCPQSNRDDPRRGLQAVPFPTRRVLAMLCKIVFGAFLAAAILTSAPAQERYVVAPQMGHATQINALAYSPDGKLLASASKDKTIKLWDASGRELHTFAGHTRPVLSVAFSPDGKRIASAGADDTIRIWSVDTGTALQRLDAPGVNDAVFSPDGKLLISGSRDGTIRLWNTADWQSRSLNAGGAVKSVAFSPDGKLFASAGDNQPARLWDADGGRQPVELRGEASVVAFSPDGRQLAAGGMDGTIAFFDTTSGRPLGVIAAHDGSEITSLSFSPDGRLLASGSWDKTVKVWQLPGRTLKRLLRETDCIVGIAVAFSPDGRYLAAAGRDAPGRASAIRVWGTLAWGNPRLFTGHASPVKSIALSPGGRLMAEGRSDGTVRLWDLTIGEPDVLQLPEKNGVKPRLAFQPAHEADVNAVAFSPDGALLASGGNDGTINIWSVARRALLKALPIDPGNVSKNNRNVIHALAFSPDGKRLAAGCQDTTIRLLRTSDWTEQAKLEKRHTGPVLAVSFAPDGLRLASAGGDARLVVWDLGNGSTQVLTGHVKPVFAVVFAPDGKRLVSGADDLTVRLWNLSGDKPPAVLTGHEGGVTSVAFSPDGRTVVSAGWDHTLRSWDIESGRTLATTTIQTGAINAIALSQDGKAVVSASEDGLLRLWDLPELAERAAFAGFDDGSFLTITPQGYFESSSISAEENLAVHIGGKVYSMASYRDEFYSPELVRRALGGASLADFPKLGAVSLAPSVEIAPLPERTNSGNAILRLNILNNGGGIGKLRIYRNGVAVAERRFDLPSSSGTDPEVDVPVTLESGLNTVEAVAYNADGSMQSNKSAPISIDNTAATHPKLHTLIIGIGDVANPAVRSLLHLNYAVSDAEWFARAMDENAQPILGANNYRPNPPLVTPDQTGKDTLVKILKDLKSTVGPDDRFVLYIAGHGFVSRGKFYIITANVASMDASMLTRDALSGDMLTQLISEIPAAQKFVVLDTCNAGAATKDMLLGELLADRGKTIPAAQTVMARDAQVAVLAATLPQQDANEGYKKHGLFTYVLISGLKGEKGKVLPALPRDTVVDTLWISNYLNRELPLLAKELGVPVQMPTPGSYRSFDLTRVR